MSGRGSSATGTEIRGQLDLLALLADDAGANGPEEAGRSLYATATRGVGARPAEFDLWRTQHGAVGSLRISHAWRVGISHPAVPTEQCQPTVLDCDLRCSCFDGSCHCVGDLIYRGGCLRCDWEGEERRGEDGAVADGLDHAHPGWRDSPIVTALRYDATKRRGQLWQDTVLTEYGDRAAGWPIITDRPGDGTRAVPGRSPWGGYDVAATTRDETGPGHPRFL